MRPPLSPEGSKKPGETSSTGSEFVRPAAELTRLFALGLASDLTRRRALDQATAEETRLAPEVIAAQLAGESSARRLALHWWGVGLARHVLRSFVPIVARRTAGDAGPRNTPTERGWQVAVCAALAGVPPLVVAENQPPKVETVREIVDSLRNSVV